jgi:uncharacterized protein (TIGR03435 family)
MKAIFLTLLLAQAPAAPGFEVASVKPNTSGARASSTHSLPGGRVTMTNVTVRQLILGGYGLRGLQLTGGPSWIDSDRFDIDALSPENTPPEQVFPMVRTLLADRFKLVVHMETKEQPVYALVLARADKKLGPQLKESTLDCTTPRQPGSPTPCGMNTNTSNAGGNMKGGDQTLANLAEMLANFVADRMVIDRTGLIGKYDFELRWTSQNLQTAQPNPADGPRTQDAPSIFVALPEQLGLKLEAQRGPVEFLVIDSIQHPEPN